MTSPAVQTTDHRTTDVQTPLPTTVAAPLGCTRPVRVAPREPGQATTEYALILLVAAVVAILVIGWATTGGGGGRIGGLFDSVLDMILRRAESAP